MSDWITTGEAATISGYHAERVRELVRAGAVKAQKFGREWMVDRASLLTYVRLARRSRDKRRGPKRE